MNTPSQTPAFDAFGDVVPVASPRVSSTKRARKLTVAVFWSIAVLLAAGRFCQSDIGATSQTHTMAMASR